MPGETLDTGLCECAPTDYCPPIGDFSLLGLFSVFSDAFGHSCCHHVPVGQDVTIPFNRLDGTFTSPGLPGQDVPPLSGTIVNDPLTGCLIEGSGTGTFAGYSNSSCQLQDGMIVDGTFTGQLSCTPSAFPGQPIIFDLDGSVTVP